MARLLLKSLTCHTTYAPFGSDDLRLKVLTDGKKSSARDVAIGYLTDGEVHSFEGHVAPIEFHSSAHLELLGPEGRYGEVNVTGDREWQLTAEIRHGDGHYSLRYVVVLEANNGELAEAGDCADGVCKTKPVECNVSDPVEPCPLANLVVEVKSTNGVPVVGAKITLTALSQANRLRVVATGVTDSYGIVNFGRVESGPYALTATKHRHSPDEVMYPIEVGVAETKRVTLTLDPPYLYFALYYTKPKDKAFERAAQTWKRDLLARSTYHDKQDDVVMLGFLTETDFLNAWKAVQTQAVGWNRRIIEGHVFSHGTPDGLELPDGTLTVAEIRAMLTLQWERPGGELALHGCRTAVGGTDSPAAAFADRQRVRTTAFQGYGRFSENKDDYIRTNPQSDDMYLNDYSCRDVCEPKEFHPPAEAKR